MRVRAARDAPRGRGAVGVGRARATDAGALGADPTSAREHDRGDEGSGEQTVSSGTSDLRSDGTFDIHFTPAADERQNKHIQYSYAVRADLTDEGGETRSATRSFRLGFVAVDATITSDEGFIGQGQASKLTIRRHSLDGSPRAGEGRYELFALKEPKVTLPPADQARPEPQEESGATKRYQTPGDKQFPRWDRSRQAESILASFADGELRASGKLPSADDLTLSGVLVKLHESGQINRFAADHKAEAAKALPIISTAAPGLTRPLTLGGGSAGAPQPEGKGGGYRGPFAKA